MARGLDDHPEVESAEFEAEHPARKLTGLPKLVVSVAAVAVSLYALYWVIAPSRPSRSGPRSWPSPWP